MLSLDVVTPPSQIIVIDNTKLEEFKVMSNVDDIAPLASFSSSVTYGDLTSSIMLRSVNSNYFRYAGVRVANGDLFTDEETDKIVLSSAVLKLFDAKPEDMIGKYISIKVLVPTGDGKVQETPLNKQYRIKGVVEDETSLFAFMPLKELSSQVSIPFYERVRVKVASREVINQAEKEFLDKGFIVNALSKTVEQANKIFRGIQIMLAVFGGIALIVSAIGMFNTMTVTLLERTKEIGIMRTIGASNLTIEILFLSEAIIMGFFGGLSGVVIGVGGGLGFNFALGMLAKRMGGVAVGLFDFPIGFLVFMIVFSALLGALTGWFPAKRAAMLNPLDAIRYS
jgi:ABC-type antimicrobial peptide transport system permease subunit